MKNTNLLIKQALFYLFLSKKGNFVKTKISTYLSWLNFLQVSIIFINSILHLKAKNEFFFCIFKNCLKHYLVITLLLLCYYFTYYHKTTIKIKMKITVYSGKAKNVAKYLEIKPAAFSNSPPSDKSLDTLLLPS